MYDVRDIIGELSYFEGLPGAALKAASERRHELVRLFLDEFARAVDAPKEIDQDSQLLFFAFHLLGEWRETSAHRPLARFLRVDPDVLEVVLGDATTETAHRVMASVFDGDPQPLFDIILDAKADQFARSRMCEVLAMLAIDGRLPRGDAIAFLSDVYPSLKNEEGNAVLDGWQTSIAFLGAAELTPLVREAFETELIPPFITTFDWFEKDLASALANPDRPWARKGSEYELWGNTADEFANWSGFQPRPAGSRSRDVAPVWQAPDQPYVNPLRGVGRNDLCPCGSGKKYKICCLT